MRRVLVSLGATALVLVAVACGSKTGLLTDGVAFQGGGSGDGGPKDGSGDTLGPLACTPGQFTLARAGGQIVFVLDRSGSMRFTLDGNEPNPFVFSRWRLLGEALDPMIRSLESDVEIGAKFFPDVIDDPRFLDPEEACTVSSALDVLPAKLSAAQVRDVFRNTQPSGGTPTSEGLRQAATYLSAPDRRSVARFMVLATDGAPNCNGQIKDDPRTCVCTSTDPGGCTEDPTVGRYNCLDDVRTVETIRDAATRLKIPTYVLGLGSDKTPAFTGALDRMAIAGERGRPTSPHYYNVTNPEELEKSLASIASSISRCSYVTPSRPNDPDAITITINGVPIPRDPTRQNGWEWIDRDFGEIALFGSACAALTPEAGPTPAVAANVRCD
ncbi:MAG: VWA domain-containing protein [Myxococcales bacterium]|jgi:hypothetical protein|nr:VWA domain-containing protein [Myxococcales bacterium]